MEGYIKAIGGEHWFTLEMFKKNNDNFKDLDAVFLSGGQSAIRFVIEDIDFSSSDFILMPSYLCPSILYPLIEKNIKYEFYNVQSDLSIDLDNLRHKISKYSPKAIFFIDYFGFYNNKETIDFMNQCKLKGIKIIEDAVQMFWFNNKKFIGDYVFNSYRKFLPIDGSVVVCNNVNNYYWSKDNYYEIINTARMNKSLYYNYNIGKEDDFLELFRLAEEEYYNRDKIIGLDNNSKYMLSKIDEAYISRKRIENYRYVYNKLIGTDKVKILYNTNQISDNVPLGIPILVKERNNIRKFLASKNIFCPVHWNISEINFFGNSFYDNKYLSENILMIPIDHRYDFEDLNRVIANISLALT
ncbi:hypothetical protein HMPREF1982_03809 [Clostridiales bacterium oral taxon 876 str. F0540]|nr:hypothetical protein HMPREF1982_03809 [Clostridiales bacterium oral taxon 876 str. F0540]